MYKSEAFPCGQANTQGRKLPSSAEEGWPKAGVVLVRNRFARTAPPRLRGLGGFAAFLERAATPPRLRRGVLQPGESDCLVYNTAVECDTNKSDVAPCSTPFPLTFDLRRPDCRRTSRRILSPNGWSRDHDGGRHKSGGTGFHRKADCCFLEHPRWQWRRCFADR